MSASLDINPLFQAAQSHGALFTASRQALTIADFGAMIQAGLRTPVDDVTASAAVLWGGLGYLNPLLALEVSTMPIIQSLLDSDFYKFTMGHWVFKRYPHVPVRYAFKNRTARGAAGGVH